MPMQNTEQPKYAPQRCFVFKWATSFSLEDSSDIPAELF
jgi:hypothetical protein